MDALVTFFSLGIVFLKRMSLSQKLAELLIYTVGIVTDRHWYLEQTNVLFKHSDLAQLFFQDHNREQSCSVNHTSLKKPPREGCLPACTQQHYGATTSCPGQWVLSLSPQTKLPVSIQPLSWAHQMGCFMTCFLTMVTSLSIWILWGRNQIWRKTWSETHHPNQILSRWKVDQVGIEKLNYSCLWKNRVLLMNSKKY